MSGTHAHASERLARNSIAEPNSGCVLWTGSFSKKGYGHIKVDGKCQLAHRVAWEIKNGPVPSGLCVCHKCDTPACINVDHLFIGTNDENMADRSRKGRQARLIGERNPRAVLSAADVLAIRRSSESNSSLGRRFGVTPQAIRLARIGANWSFL